MMTESPIVNSWIEQAQMKTLRDAILQVLRKRFGAEVPTAIQETIASQPSYSMLEQWHGEAVSVASMDDFLAVLRR